MSLKQIYSFLIPLTLLFLLSLSAASAAPKPHVLFSEKFEGKSLNPHFWDVHTNNGSVSVQDRVVTITSTDLYQFPFVQLNVDPFPTDKPFTLSWDMAITGMDLPTVLQNKIQILFVTHFIKATEAVQPVQR